MARLLLAILIELVLSCCSRGADLGAPIPARPVACFNCPSCGDACTCFGGGYYCEPGKCAAQRPLKAKDVMPKVLSYEELFARVQKGEKLVLAVGPYQLLFADGKYNADGATVSLPGIAPGIYDCFLLNGKPYMQLRNESGVVPGPTTPRATFIPWAAYPQQACPNGRCPLVKP